MSTAFKIAAVGALVTSMAAVITVVALLLSRDVLVLQSMHISLDGMLPGILLHLSTMIAYALCLAVVIPAVEPLLQKIVHRGKP